MVYELLFVFGGGFVLLLVPLLGRKLWDLRLPLQPEMYSQHIPLPPINGPHKWTPWPKAAQSISGPKGRKIFWTLLYQNLSQNQTPPHKWTPWGWDPTRGVHLGGGVRWYMGHKTLKRVLNGRHLCKDQKSTFRFF